MLSRKTVIMSVLVPLLFSPVVASGAESESVKTGSEKVTKEQFATARETATATTFSPATVEFLRRPLASQLVTINPSGSPQATIMWFRYEDGALLFTTTTDRVKFRNIQKNPRATLVVTDPANMYRWVVVDGKLSVDNRDPAAFYRGLAEHYLDAESLAEWQKRAGMDKRTVLKLMPTQIRTMGFPAP
jgi:PPOX class probable F420-dependent enzyme